MYQKIETLAEGMTLRERGTSNIHWTIARIKDDICILTRDDRPSISRTHRLEEVVSGDIYTADPVATIKSAG
ncbi:hypothetical protein [Fodinicurvata sp. EGI_FJ10296]|uniref:hypothetical protein n=1 Tax=Fodinicurvata sp. EGI_FJ10296 TaxID=3231908 RepID=UPI0034513B32